MDRGDRHRNTYSGYILYIGKEGSQIFTQIRWEIQEFSLNNLDIGKKYKFYAYIYKGRVTRGCIIISNLHEPPPLEQVTSTQTTLQLTILPSTNKRGTPITHSTGSPLYEGQTDTHKQYNLNSR